MEIQTKRYIRENGCDRRIARGDDFAGDAWRDLVTGSVTWVAVGRDPNEALCDHFQEHAACVYCYYEFCA